jgi:hypothetical protein
VTNYAKALRYLQGLDDGVKPPFTIREWMTNEKYDNSWLFISTQARHRKSVRPLISLWVSLATLLLQSMGENSDRRVWFIYDEIPSLQRIPELPETLAEGRKFGGCFVLGAQNMAQLVHVYGRELAKSIFDLLNTRMYGRSPSAEMAKMVEEELGHQRRREIREQNSFGLDQVRDGVSLGKDKVNNPIVDYEKIMSLPNLNFYVRLPGEYPVVRLALKYKPLKKLNAGLIERNFRDVLSPELEKVIVENERATSALGLAFQTGDELLEKGKDSLPDTPDKPVATARQEQEAAPLSRPVTKPQTKPANKPEQAPVPERRAQPKPASASPCEPETSGARITVPAAVVAALTNSIPTDVTVPDNVVSLHRSPGVPPQPSAPAQISEESDALQRLRSLTSRREPEVGSGTSSVLDALKKARMRPTGEAEEGADATEGGETHNLDMKVVPLVEGGLELKTAGIQEHKDDNSGTPYATKNLAQEEENILRHRDPDDPGYSAYDLYHDDGERDL